MFRSMKKTKLVTMFVSFVAAISLINVYSSESISQVAYADGPVFDGGLSGVTVSGDDESGFQLTGVSNSTKGALESALAFIKWISLAGTLLLLGVFVINLLKLGSSGTNVQARAAAQQGLVWSGISAAVLSISSTVFFFLSGALTSAASKSET